MSLVWDHGSWCFHRTIADENLIRCVRSEDTCVQTACRQCLTCVQRCFATQFYNSVLQYSLTIQFYSSFAQTVTASFQTFLLISPLIARYSEMIIRVLHLSSQSASCHSLAVSVLLVISFKQLVIVSSLAQLQTQKHRIQQPIIHYQGFSYLVPTTSFSLQERGQLQRQHI